MAQHLPYREYYCSVEDAKQCLEEYGVAVVPVLSADECESLKTQANAEIYSWTQGKVKLDEPATWRNWFDLFPLHSMLVQYFGVGHLRWMWALRQHPAVSRFFSTIWGVPPEDLLVSFDGMSLHLPPEQTKRGWYRGNDWLHTDQAAHRRGLHCVQGWINLEDTDEGDATLCVRRNPLWDKTTGTSWVTRTRSAFLPIAGAPRSPSRHAAARWCSGTAGCSTRAWSSSKAEHRHTHDW